MSLPEQPQRMRHADGLVGTALLDPPVKRAAEVVDLRVELGERV